MTTNPLPPLPDTFTTMLDQVITTADDLWIIQLYLTLKEQGVIQWSKLTDHLAPEVLHTIQLYMIQVLRQSKPNTALTFYGATLHFARWLHQHKSACHPFQWSYIDEELFRDYLAYCYNNLKTKGERAQKLRQFYAWGTSNAYPGFNHNTHFQLQQLRIKKNPEGVIVRSHHPTKSAFTNAERQQILDALVAERGTPFQRALVWILLETGARPLAIALLQNQHLRCFNEGPDLHYHLTMTEVKQPRTQPTYATYKISKELGQLLESLQIPNALPTAPLLPQLNTQSANGSINQRLQVWSKNAGLLSRDGETPLHLFAYRFRRDFATNAIERGVPPEEVALLMGHNSFNSTLPYVESGPAFAKQSEAALITTTGHLFQTFRGQLTTKDDVQTATLPETPPLPLSCQPTIVCGLGKCARDITRSDLCQLDGALACFTCPSFQPFGDALPEFEIALHDVAQALPMSRTPNAQPQSTSWLTSTYVALTEIIQQIKEQPNHVPTNSLPTSRKRTHRKSATPVPA